MKKFISGLLGILFVVLVVVGVFICTYVFNQPSRSGDSLYDCLQHSKVTCR